MPPSFRRECGHLPLCEPRRAKGCHCLESVVLLISTNLYLKDAVTSHPYKPVLTRTHLYLKDAITFFRSAKHEKEDVARSLAMQCIPFPRLHFFMLSTAMGQSLQEKDILVPSFSVGSDAGLDPSKYASAGKGKMAAFFLSNSELAPVNGRVLPGKDGVGVTVCMPGKTLIDAFRAVNLDQSDESNLKWTSVLAPDVKNPTELLNPFDDMELAESVYNLADLCSEMEQYSFSDSS